VMMTTGKVPCDETNVNATNSSFCKKGKESEAAAAMLLIVVASALILVAVMYLLETLSFQYEAATAYTISTRTARIVSTFSTAMLVLCIAVAIMLF
jgi:hypothetical protein